MITLTPAYNRDYKSKKALMDDIKANKDFILNDYMSPWSGKPISPNDLKGQTILFRYSNLKKVTSIKI